MSAGSLRRDLFGNRRSRLRWFPSLRRALKRRYLRRRVFAVALGEDRVLCRVLGRHLLYANARDESISPHLIVRGEWEAPVTEAIVDLLRPGMSAVDVGANLGYYTLLMAELCGPSGRVLAFEPNPETAALLRSTIAVNGLAGRVTLAEEALGDAEGSEVVLYMPPDHPGGTRFKNLPADGSHLLTAPTRRLDRIPAAHDAALVKIDAEGMEELVWHGMAGLVAGDKLRHIVVEFTALSYSDPAGFLDQARAAGFALRRIGGRRGPVPVSRDAVLAGPHQQMLLMTR